VGSKLEQCYKHTGLQRNTDVESFFYLSVFTVRKLLIAVCLLTYPTHILAAKPQANEKLWDLNLAAGIASIPHYIGSDQRYTLKLIFPYMIYRGEILQADKHGIRGRFFEQGKASIDLDFSFGLPVYNNGARQGMPNLGLVGQVGPQFNWEAFHNEYSKLYLHFPLRLAIDTKQTFLDWVAAPRVDLEHDFGEEKQFTISLEGELLYASKKYGDYYYGVAPEYATPNRQTYRAKQGLHYISLKFGFGIQHNPTLQSGLFIQAKSLSHGIISDSPLVKKQAYLSVGAGLTWTFMTSSEGAFQHIPK